MSNLEKFYIDGQWVEPLSDKRADVINPATEESVGKVALGSCDDAERAISAARKAFQTYSKTTREQRLELLGSIAAVLKKRLGEVGAAVSSEMGAPLKSVAIPIQAGSMLGHLKVFSDILKSYEFHEDQGPTRIVRESIGVCGFITPWNWPVQQIACKVIPALAAGCTIVLKPSKLSPLSAVLLAEILDEAGVPAGVFNLVNGDGTTVGNTFASHPEVDLVSFTGSTGAGVSVSQAAAPTVKKVALELGGKSANIILDDADFKKTVSRSVMGFMMNSGQTCAATSRMLVPRERLSEVEAIAKAMAESLVVGDPLADDTFMGPVANEAQYRTVVSMIQTGIDEGAKLLTGGVERPQGLDKGFYVKPTIFSDVNNEMAVAREEIFGPVLCILPYDSEEEAVEIANDSEYGLAGAVFSANLERAQSVASRMRTGMVILNGAQPDMSAPFGGYKKSGVGREWGRHGFEEFFEIKSILGHNPS